MKTMQPSQKGASTDEQRDRTIDHGRFVRAVTEDFAIDDHAPRMYDVTNAAGVTRTVDVETGTCGCSDYQYRGDRVLCKHVLFASLHHAFRRTPNTAVVARVLRVSREAGCVHGVRGCGGPTQLGERGIPCEGCISASSTGHWTVWNRLTKNKIVEPDVAESIAMTDGGRQ